MGRQVQPQKYPFPWGSGSRRIHGSLDPHESAPNFISIGSAVFAQLVRAPNTHTHTDTQTMLRVTSVAAGRIYALRVGDAA